jgi:hypothetical protein
MCVRRDVAADVVVGDVPAVQEEGSMKRWTFVIDITEHRRRGYVDAETREKAIGKIRAGAWDCDEGLSDPEGYTTTIVGKIEEAADEPV